jgi:hypothetical protein
VSGLARQVGSYAVARSACGHTQVGTSVQSSSLSAGIHVTHAIHVTYYNRATGRDRQWPINMPGSDSSGQKLGSIAEQVQVLQASPDASKQFTDVC